MADSFLSPPKHATPAWRRARLHYAKKRKRQRAILRRENAKMTQRLAEVRPILNRFEWQEHSRRNDKFVESLSIISTTRRYVEAHIRSNPRPLPPPTSSRPKASPSLTAKKKAHRRLWKRELHDKMLDSSLNDVASALGSVDSILIPRWHKLPLRPVVDPYKCGWSCDVCKDTGHGLVWHCAKQDIDVCIACTDFARKMRWVVVQPQGQSQPEVEQEGQKSENHPGSEVRQLETLKASSPQQRKQQEQEPQQQTNEQHTFPEMMERKEEDEHHDTYEDDDFEDDFDDVCNSAQYDSSPVCVEA